LKYNLFDNKNTTCSKHSLIFSRHVDKLDIRYPAGCMSAVIIVVVVVVVFVVVLSRN